jgi:hypothetical protein
MTPLKRVLILLLAGCMIGYGNAWAFESHIVKNMEFGVIDFHADSQIDHQNTEHHDSEKSPCDHCCHASAHMLALCARSNFQISNQRTHLFPALSQEFVSHIGSLAFKPPRV